MKVFLDANILFSASNPEWLTRRLLEALLDAGAALVTSRYAMEEAERNVRRHGPERIPELHALLGRVTRVPDGTLVPGVDPLLAEKDRPILDAAILAGCTHLLTGDLRHFGPRMGTTVGGVRIVSQRLLALEAFGR